MNALEGKKGLIVGIANEHSLAYGCARHMRAAGADLAITYLNAKAEPHVRPLAQALQSEIVVPCDVTVPGQIDAVFERIAKAMGPPRFPAAFHRLCQGRRPARPHRRLLGGRLRLGHAGVLHSFLRMASWPSR